MHRWLYLGLVTLLLPVCAIAHIRHVPADYQTIQSGINAAESGDTVLVQPGVYEESLLIETASITLASTILTTNDFSMIDSTIIDAGSNDCGIAINLTDTATALIRGFTVRNGRQEYGGGIDCQHGRPVIEDMVIKECIAGWWGGGIYLTNGSEATFRRCTVSHNQALWGGGVGVYLSTLRMEECWITDNSANMNGGGLSETNSGNPGNIFLDHVLIANNVAGDTAAAFIYSGHFQGDHLTVVGNRATGAQGQHIGGMGFRRQDADHCSITNSIIFDNGFGNLAVSVGATVSYCDIEGGRDALRLGDGAHLVWGEGNIAADPLFVEPDGGNYRLSEGSPCIDSGNPEYPPDPDGSRTDMGVRVFDEINAWVYGRVYDAASGAPLRAMIITQHGFITSSNDSGLWRISVRGRFDSVRVELAFEVAQYCPKTIDTLVRRGDSLWLDVGLEHGELHSLTDSLIVAVDSSGSATLPVSIQNTGNGPLRWNAKGQFAGADGAPAWTVRQSIAVGDTTDDDRIEGVVFDGENFYAAGANGTDSSAIYVMDRAGNLIRTFDQPTHTRYGMRDLDWDGELIWGSGDSIITGFDREGRVQRELITGVYSPNNNIACDAEHGLIWASGTTTNIIGYDDRNGNPLDTLNRKGLRIYGLAYFPNDPDGCNLYILTYAGGHGAVPAALYKMNVATGDTIRAFDIPLPDAAVGVGGAFICNNYDRYHRAVLIYTLNISPGSGGDRTVLLQLQQNEEWLTVAPSEGEISAGDRRQVDVVIHTAAPDSSWAFGLGEYDGEIRFTHDGFGGETILPLHLTIRSPMPVTPTEASLPSGFGFTSLYPQPFNSTLTLSYHLAAPGLVTLTLTDLLGREIFGRTGVPPVSKAFQSVGAHRVSFDATGLPSGIYLARLEAGGSVSVLKTVLVK